ncbi:MAG TPA: PorT family protein [Candidatus Coprenecus stercoravium]|uniref:PorT family protein n=1 Tax=Candidatus Coprenecus stercoravium TaxID=2840735 RepID=A0A9D2GPS0_9BACT|nr:PorT family protein [Candidatus Coprenecus stercoravium]
MRPQLSIITIILLSIIPLSVSGQNKRDSVQKIQPGIQWDTTVKVLEPKFPEHLIGIRYDFAFTGVQITPDMGIKSINSPFNIAVLYTYYHPLWGVYDFFGLQTGLRYSKYGFVNGEYQFQHFEQTVSFVELPFLSAFHVDIGEHFRILISLGPFIGYRFATTKDNGFDCFDIRFDYGIVGGAGVAYIVNKWLELHLEGAYHYSLSMLYHPEKLSSISWIYSYPWQASINFGVHFKIK